MHGVDGFQSTVLYSIDGLRTSCITASSLRLSGANDDYGNSGLSRSCLEFIIHLQSTCRQLASSSLHSEACGTLVRNSQETPCDQPKPFSTMTEVSQAKLAV